MPYVSIKKSTNPKKKLMAVFTRHDGSKKTTHFGSAGMEDFTITKDKAQRKRYLDRHRKNENWGKPESAGSLSRWILWSGPSRRENIKTFKKRFGYKN
tara:strand:+ start:511 stop:804 length:294 start_codon:yes stop_codon:yes gene_type:complete